MPKDEREQPRDERRSPGRLLALAVLLLVGVLVAGGFTLAARPATNLAVQTLAPPATDKPPEPLEKPKPPPEAPQDPQTPEEPAPPVTLEKLEDRIGEITEYHGGDYGIVVFDPETGQKISLEGERVFFAASLGKLPTLISLYKSAERGEVDLDAEISILDSDVQGYGTGVLHDYPVGTTMSLRDCAHHMINVSDNTAWAMLTRYLGEETIRAELEDLGARDTSYWVPNTTTPEDVLLMLEKVADPAFTSQESSEEMIAAMTDTAFEDRIAGGLPDDVRVAHKIGSYEASFIDAGVVFYKDRDGVERRYFIVVVVENAGEETALHAIREVSRVAHEALTGEPSA